jgi:hypothetical protein
MDVMNIIIALAFAGILISLGAAGVFMLRGSNSKSGQKKNMARALTFRIAISVALFVLILILWAMGIIQPTGIIPGQL